MDHPNQEGTLAAGGAVHTEVDGQFDRMAPWESLNEYNNGPAEYQVITNSWEDQCLRQATLVLTMPRNQIRRLVKPPLPQVGMVPRNIHHQEAPTVEEIFAECSRLYPDSRRFYSGSPVSLSGSPRNQWGSMFG